MEKTKKVQPWKLNPDIMAFRSMHASAKTPIEPANGRVNFYPEGSIMYNGGQGAGNGNRDIIYDTETGGCKESDAGVKK